MGVFAMLGSYVLKTTDGWCPLQERPDRYMAETKTIPDGFFFKGQLLHLLLLVVLLVVVGLLVKFRTAAKFRWSGGSAGRL